MLKTLDVEPGVGGLRQHKVQGKGVNVVLGLAHNVSCMRQCTAHSMSFACSIFPIDSLLHTTKPSGSQQRLTDCIAMFMLFGFNFVRKALRWYYARTQWMCEARSLSIVIDARSLESGSLDWYPSAVCEEVEAR